MANPQPPLKPPQALDEVRVYPPLTIRDATGAPVVDRYVDGDVLEASVWAGDNQVALYHPEVTWDDSYNAAVSMRVDGPAAAAGGVAEGVYFLAIKVLNAAASGEDERGYYGQIEFTDAPGSATPDPTYASLAHLTTYAPEVRQLAGTSGLSGFLSQLAAARAEFDERVVNRYRPVEGRARRYLNAAGTAAGPHLRFVVEGPDGESAPTADEVKNWLATDRLIRSPSLIKANAYLAAALIYEGQIPAAGSDSGAANVYAGMAKMYRDRWEAEFAALQVDFDTTEAEEATTPTVRIDRDVTWLT